MVPPNVLQLLQSDAKHVILIAAFETVAVTIAG